MLGDSARSRRFYFMQTDRWFLERRIYLAVGINISVASMLSLVHSPWWLAFTGFVGGERWCGSPPPGSASWPTGCTGSARSRSWHPRAGRRPRRPPRGGECRRNAARQAPEYSKRRPPLDGRPPLPPSGPGLLDQHFRGRGRLSLRQMHHQHAIPILCRDLLLGDRAPADGSYGRTSHTPAPAPDSPRPRPPGRSPSCR